MKLFINMFSKEAVENYLDEYKHIDFSLFVECIPQNQEDLSSINIITFHEPNEYFGLHDWVIQNQNMFNVILTWSNKVLNNCENALFLPFGHTWFKPDQYEIVKEKKFEIAHLCGVLLKSYGHTMRHEILARQNELKIPVNFYKTIGDRHNIEDARIGKETVFGNSMFGIAIENFSHQGYFTEKILDCFLMRTIPIYWGGSNIDQFFNPEGIIKFENVDDFIYKSNHLTENDYFSKIDIIEENYQKALQYVNHEKNISNKVIEIFKYNNFDK